MKKAFTLLELVFVIVVIGILTTVILPSTRSDKLREAATQLVTDIRYTQHLAMIDDKFDANEPEWFQRRWMLRFRENLSFTATLPPVATYNAVWAYTIASDLPNYNGHHPDLVGMALNPLNSEQYLSGGYDNTLHVEDPKSMKELRLGSHYGITDVTFGGGCRSTVTYIQFDHLGRPFNSFPTNSPYETAAAGWHKLLTSQCQITLFDESGNSIIIAIEPETGYVHII